MARPALTRLLPVPDRPPVHEFARLFLLVLASTILWVVVPASVDAASSRLLDAFDHQLVGSVVYALLGLATMAALAVAVSRRLDTTAGLDRLELVQLGGIASLVALVGAYWLLGVTDWPAFPGTLVTVLLAGPFGMGALALVHARASGIDLRFGAPGRAVLPDATLVTIGALAVGAGWVLVALASDLPFFRLPVDPSLVLRPSATGLLWNVVVPALAWGFGLAVLYNGAIQEGLRAYWGPSRAVAGVTAMVGALSLATAAASSATGAVATVGATVGVVVLSLAAAVVAERGVRLLSRSLEAASMPAAAGAIGVAVVALPVLGASLALARPIGLVALYLGPTAVAGVACVGYERSRSVWIAALAFAVYFTVANASLARYLFTFLS